MADAPIAFDALEPFQVHADFAAQIAFDDVFAFLNRMNNLGKLLLRQVLGPDAGINVGVLQNLLRVGRADAVNVAQRDVNALVRWNFNSNDAGHIFVKSLNGRVLESSTLPLLVPFVRANHADDAATAHHFAVLAQFLHRRSDFHFC